MLRFILFVGALTLASATVDSEWAIFKKTYNKQYENAEEEAIRRYIFGQNYERIEIHNQKFARGESTYYMGINKFSDMRKDEISASMKGLKVDLSQTNMKKPTPVDVTDLPDTVDWRDAGIVTEVKDQGSCQTCFAFSATGSMEGQHALATGELVSLSEENVIDCISEYSCESGGNMDTVFSYVISNGGIDTEASYPYLAVDEACEYSTANIGATMSSYVDVTAYSESALQDAVANIGPVSVGIDANHDSFNNYQGGIYDEPACSQYDLDHGVLVVGYGTMDGQDYWLVKNSWGADWGDEGYIYMSRNANNQCGIASYASYPLV